MHQVVHMDCLAGLRMLPDNFADSIVTDPPYGLSFMGRKWDYDVPAVEVWAECLRVLKPGGHLLAFAGTRTQHRMAVRIEDAGFEIRDMIAWVYGSGFPKSLDVSKAIDKVRDWSKVERLNAEIRRAREEAGLSLKQIGEAMQAATSGRYGTWYHRGGHMFFETGRSLPSRPEWEYLQCTLPIAPEYMDAYDEAEREVVSRSENGIAGGSGKHAGEEGSYGFGASFDITAPATDAARQWQGWGTALKPALEPITVARKPLEGTVAANVLAHGTGAINVEGCRVEPTGESRERAGEKSQERRYAEAGGTNFAATPGVRGGDPAGRWPANLIHDGSDEVLAAFPQAPGQLADASSSSEGRKTQNVYGAMRRGRGGEPSADSENVGSVGFKMKPGARRLDEGSAARFFYCAKSSKSDRGEGNNHPTVKPTDLMRYLCRLVTPPGGMVLDPFTGSGSTGKAAALEGFRFIGFEREAEYVAIARARIDAAVNNR